MVEEFATVMGALRRSVARGAVVVGVLSACFAAGAGLASANEAIRVTMDQAKLVKLPEGTSTIVIGNPAIADVSVQKNGVMVITGRMAGNTNFIALDKSGSIISESQVTVAVGGVDRLVVRRGMERESFDCSPNCLPVASLGDSTKPFNEVLGQAAAREKASRESMTHAVR